MKSRLGGIAWEFAFHPRSLVRPDKANQPVKLIVEGGRVIITPRRPKARTLADRLERYDPKKHGHEAMQAPLDGVERL